MPKKLTKFAMIASSLALALAGCSSLINESEEPKDQGDTDEATQSDTPDSDAEADDVEEEMDQAAGPNADDITYDDDLDVIASREASFGSHEIELELNRVSVSGEVMSVLFTVTNIGSKKWQIASSLDSGEFSVSLSGNDGDDSDEDLQDIKGGTTDGVTVTDDANGVVYRAAYDSSGHCLCSSDLSSSFLEKDGSLLLNTKFAAPPEDVETVSVDIPHFGSFDDVPLSR